MVTDERKIFGDYIRAEGLRETEQRSVVLDVFLGSEDHMSIEDIYRLVNRRKRRVGYATVYRTMKLIAECGLAREVMFDDGVCRFEHVVGKQHHHHLVCTRCHRVIEFTSAALDKAEKAIFAEHDFEAEYHHMKIFGLCSECRRKAETNDGEISPHRG
jgi:Fur family ferric uptake transcriptional regulator